MEEENSRSEDLGLGLGLVRCACWIRRPENAHLVAIAKSVTTAANSSSSSSAAVLEIFSFDAKTASLSSSPKVKYVCQQGEGEIVRVAVHPNGEDIVCTFTNGGCKLFELHGQDENIKLLVKSSAPLQDIGLQNCVTFSVDGSRVATGGEDGHLRIYEWPSLRILLDEPRAHKSFRDMDFSLDSEFLASTSTDGSARIWKTDDGFPLTSLTRSSDERIECCRFSKDGTKPFLFCSVQKGARAVTAVWDISTWTRIGHKRLLRKPTVLMSISTDGKYLALGSRDGDVCVADVKKMETSHWSKRLHPGTGISSVEFCPGERVMLSTSPEWGAVVTKLNVPADWKEWQIYMVLLGLFMASAVAFYIFFQNSDSFWNFPTGRDQRSRSKFAKIFSDQSSEEWRRLDM